MSDRPPGGANSAQIEFWNSIGGQTWARFQELLDRQIESLGVEALRVLAPRERERIIDVGCGCGQTTLDLGASVGPGGLIVGIDISAPMLEIARRRPLAENSGAIEFRQLDAQIDPLGRSAFDAAFSRFGVMFFSDPVAAFENIRASLRPGGRLVFVCWRPLAENPWMLAPLEAARPFMPPIPPPDPISPGPFALADSMRLRSILRGAGFVRVAIEALDMNVGAANLEDAVTLALTVGPLGAALREHPECAPKVRDAVERVVADHLAPEGVSMSAGVWIVSAANR